MRELGVTERELHQRVGRHVATAGIDCLFAVGEMGREYAVGAKLAGMDTADIVLCQTTQEAGELVLRLAPKPAPLLVKGSRGAKMEGVLEVLRASHAAPTQFAVSTAGEAR